MFGFGKALIALAVVTMIGGVITAGSMYLNGLNDKISDQALEISDLGKENLGLSVNLATTQGKLDRKDDELKSTIKTYELRKSFTAEMNDKIIETQRLVDSEKRKSQLDSLKQSRRVELLLKVINKSARCEWENFESEGICKGGKFVAKE